MTERKRNDRIVQNWPDPTRQEILYLVAKPIRVSHNFAPADDDLRVSTHFSFGKKNGKHVSLRTLTTGL